MAFTRVRTIKGKQYRYHEERWREGGKVRSRSICLGAVGGDEAIGWLRHQFSPSHGIDWAKIEQEELARQVREAAERKTFADKMHSLYGMNLTTPAVPVEKVAPAIDLAPAPEAQENAPPDDGEAEAQ